MKTIRLPSGAFQYDPMEPLGKPGGFGQVFAGRTSKGEDVAVKKLHISSADAAHRELNIADELKGRSLEFVVPIFDSGADADSGDYFVVMAKAEQSLQTFIEKSGVVSVEAAAPILFQILKGLNEVVDLVHRDLKPDNVLFHEGKWKIADFGIARFIQAVTSGNTLKECWSPEYAAPEQWRRERATHATDIYALGCISFCLLTGNPPFRTNHSEKHQKAPIPHFDCLDFRLKSLTTYMLRKNPESRPCLSRIHQVLKEIVENPQIHDRPDSFAALAEAGAKVAEREQQCEAVEQAAREEQNRRNRLAKGAQEILLENVERLWGKIHNKVPAARRFEGYQFHIELGDASLEFKINNSGRGFPADWGSRSGWDAIIESSYSLRQRQPDFLWSSSLWYAKLKGKQEYRWYEIGYFSPVSQIPSIVAAPHYRAADDALVAGRNNASLVVAYGPLLVDDEAEAEFHSRIVWLLAKGSDGQLSTPLSFPFTWPPPMGSLHSE